VNGRCTAVTTQSLTYKWVASNPSACTCSGTQTLSVQCMDSKGNVASSTFCTATPPSTTQSCTAPTSCSIWKASGFGSCTNSCGSGTQTQTISCVSAASGATVSTSLCASLTPPPTSQPCPNLPACVTQWVQGGFQSCSVSCGGGTQTQTVTW
jgi:hypothetical protein